MSLQASPAALLSLVADRRIALALGPCRERVLTALLMAIPVECLDLLKWYRQEIIGGRFRSDEALIAALFQTLDRRERVNLICTVCVAALEVSSFARIVGLAYRACSPKGKERDKIAQAISRFASLHARIESRSYQRLVESLLGSRRPWERAHGLLALASLAKVRMSQGLRVATLVRDPSPQVRGNAWIAAAVLSARASLPNAARESLARDARSAEKDPDETVRRNVRLYGESDSGTGKQPMARRGSVEKRPWKSRTP